MNLPDWIKLSQITYYLMCAQERTGFQFDREKAEALLSTIESKMSEIESVVEPQLPPRALKQAELASITFPAKPYKKDGTFSHYMMLFLERHNGSVLDQHTVEFYSKLYTIVGGGQLDTTLPMKLSNQSDLKEWFLEQGWKPTLWNYKKDANGKFVREKGKLVPTTPKIQDKGKLCPGLIGLNNDIAKQAVTWLSYRNRAAVLTGFLEHPRLQKDGRLPAGAIGLTNTHRQKHTVVVNIPRAEEGVLLGREFRELFCASKGNVLVGFDAAALEARMEAHYTYKYDNGKHAEILLDGDIHNTNTQIFFPNETGRYDILSEDFNKDDPGFKPYRSRSKNGKYALSYGCSPSKLASTLGCPPSMGQSLYDTFWMKNPALKQLRDNVTQFWETKGESQWIPGLDGRRIYTRASHSLVNALFQSAGAICMDWAGAYIDEVLGGLKRTSDGIPCYQKGDYIIKRVGYFHDEYIFECHPDIADKVGKLGCKAIKKAGENFKLKVSLDSDYKIGYSWAEIH